MRRHARPHDATLFGRRDDSSTSVAIDTANQRDTRSRTTRAHPTSIAHFARVVVDIERAVWEMLDLSTGIRSHCTDARHSAEVVPVNKGELVDAIASAANLNKAEAENALNAFISTVQDTVAAGDKVTLPGFGTFAPTLRKARTGIDPRTRQPVQIPERKSAKFSVGSKFKAQVQSS